MFSVFIMALLGAMIPGASSILVLTYSVCGSRKHGFIAVFGLAAGIICHVTFLLTCLHYFSHRSLSWIYIISLCGALYIFYHGFNYLVKKKTVRYQLKSNHVINISYVNAFVSAFIVDVTNPASLLFIVSVLSQFMCSAVTTIEKIKHSVSLISAPLLWYFLLVYLFSHDTIQSRLSSCLHWIHRFAGAMLMGTSCLLFFKAIKFLSKFSLHF